MTGRKIATLPAAPLHNDVGNAPFELEAPGLMWAQLGQHVHPHDIETQRAVRQNNGSISSTTAAYERAEHHCPRAGLAFDTLTDGSTLRSVAQEQEDLSALEAISFNGLKNELVALDIHQDHYEPHQHAGVTQEPFAHVNAHDFSALIARMPRLKHIEITCARLSSHFIEAMVAGLEGHPIEELILHHCGLCTDDLLTILEGMGRTLAHLDVSYNNFADHEVGALDFALAPNLVSLDLSHCGIDLADVNLTSCVKVRELNLSSNASGASFLMGHDMGAMPQLQVLQLNRTQLVGGSLSHLDLSCNPALHTLDLGYNALRNDDMHKFSIASSCGLRRLNVSGNAIGAEGFVTLQLKGMDGLQELNFADNDLKDYSRLWALHSPTLAAWPNLHWLDLAGCEGITKVNILALGLEKAPRLAYLDLSATQLNDETFAALPWIGMARLRTFRAEFNHISGQGVFLAAFERCGTLCELDLQHHAMTRQEAARAFVDKKGLALAALWLTNGEAQEAFPRMATRADASVQPLLDKLRQQLGAKAHIEI